MYEENRNILVDFNMLVDTDFGAALYIVKNSTNKNYFVEDYLDSTLDFFRFQAMTRPEENPIEYLFKDEYRGYSDTIYGELMAEKWDRVLEYSPVTDILRLMLAGTDLGGYKITVNCRNQAEVDRLKLANSKWPAEIEIKDISKYICLYIHDILEIERNEWDIKGKTVYVYNYGRNHIANDLSNDGISELALRWAGKSQFNFINPYNTFVLPEGYGGKNEKTV
jgi:hypothetical protein